MMDLKPKSYSGKKRKGKKRKIKSTKFETLTKKVFGGRGLFSSRKRKFDLATCVSGVAAFGRLLQWRHPEFCFRGAKYTFANIGGANHGFTVIKSQILQVLKHPSPPCCDATGLLAFLPSALVNVDVKRILHKVFLIMLLFCHNLMMYIFKLGMCENEANNYILMDRD